MMKKRLEILESKTGSLIPDAEQLMKLGNRWWNTLNPIDDADWDCDKAKETRLQADPIFNRHPEWKKKPPAENWNKYLLKEWAWFANYLESKYRESYKQAVKKNEWPPILTEENNEEKKN